MSLKLINRSPDINKLRSEGYEVEIVDDYLLVHNVPYLNSNKEVAFGTLVSNVSIVNDSVTKPNNHVIHFKGEMPCNKDGTPILQIKHQSQTKNLTSKITVDHSFSNRPQNGYPDHYEKFVQYIKIISSPAQFYDPNADAKTFKVIESKDEDCVHNYIDTNSSRAEINFTNQKLSKLKIGIVGLGGTGSYILDFVCKTPVAEIHLFDGDKFLQHNAFRSPGAASMGELKEHNSKVEYYQRIYSKMHKHIVSHEYFLTKSNVGNLKDLDFVFVCIDKGEIKKALFKKMQALDIPFTDTGIGIESVDDSLLATVRTTTSTSIKNDHIWKDRISFSDDVNNEYSSNIQIAEINALNAVFAVIKWKKLFGFYTDSENEFHSTYTTYLNLLTSDEIAA